MQNGRISSPPSGLRVCTSSYVFNLSLMIYIMGFVNIDGSYDVSMSVFCYYRHLSLKACGHDFRFWFSLEDKRGLSLGELICPFSIMVTYCYL